jgi:hypothetical protein
VLLDFVLEALNSDRVRAETVGLEERNVALVERRRRILFFFLKK